MSRPFVLVSRLSGGLGNQLFQYAAARGIADSIGALPLIDVTLLSDPAQPRPFALAPFALGVAAVTRSAIPKRQSRMVDVELPPDASALLNARTLQLPIRRERGYRYDPEVARPGDMYLEGFWQSPRYFGAIADAIRAAVGWPQGLADERLQARRRDMQACESVAVHVRRGDYLVEPHHSFHGVCEKPYYAAAMDALRARRAGARFFLFSDDPRWCSENLQADDIEIVSGADTPAHHDLWLMSSCRHHVIANSTLGWWGAWLAQHPDQVVAAPVPWYSRVPLAPDLIPAQWLHLERRTGAPWDGIREKIAATKVSVVLPTRDRMAMLREAADSVLAQSHANLELVLSLNDPSPATVSAAEQISALDRRVSIVSRPVPGLGAARNAGVAAATGEWVAFLDDDDVWLPDKIATQLAAAILLDADVVTCNASVFDERGAVEGTALPPLPEGLSLAEALMLGNFVSGGSAAMVRRSALAAVAPFDVFLPSCEDNDLWRRLAWTHNFVVIDDVLLRIRRHGQSMLANNALMVQGTLMHMVKMIEDTPPELRHMLPAAVLRHMTLFHDYLRDHGLAYPDPRRRFFRKLGRSIKKRLPWNKLGRR
jgi:hypothetical protein